MIFHTNQSSSFSGSCPPCSVNFNLVTVFLNASTFYVNSDKYFEIHLQCDIEVIFCECFMLFGFLNFLCKFCNILILKSKVVENVHDACFKRGPFVPEPQ